MQNWWVLIMVLGNWSGNAQITTDYWETEAICEKVAKAKTEVWLEALKSECPTCRGQPAFLSAHKCMQILKSKADEGAP